MKSFGIIKKVSIRTNLWTNISKRDLFYLPTRIDFHDKTYIQVSVTLGVIPIFVVRVEDLLITDTYKNSRRVCIQTYTLDSVHHFEVLSFAIRRHAQNIENKA